MSDSNHRVVLASGNQGKLKELGEMLAGIHLEVVPQSDFSIPEAEETGLSFVENAIIKARHAAQHCGLPAIADDSGIEVDCLQGAPGIYSARYAGPGATDGENLQKLLKETEAVPEAQRSARFHCVIAYVRHAMDPTPILCHGVWEGRLLQTPEGENGFGYDPIFYVPEQGCSSAQLPAEIKNRLSHRGQALRQLLAALTQQTSTDG